jgi:ankyrin repeat protein
MKTALRVSAEDNKGCVNLAVSHSFYRAKQDPLNDKFLEAVTQNNVEAARGYIDRGANINARFDNEDTGLLHAVRKGHDEMALMLIEKKASLDAQGGADGATALILAVKAKNKKVAGALIDANADISLEDRDGVKAFKHAMRTADPEMVQLFEKPMMTILRSIPSSEVAERLRNSNKNLDEIEPLTGETALTFAASQTNQEGMAQAFIEAGADLRATNRAGKTPMQVAEETGNSSMQKLLAEAQQSRPQTPEKRGPLKPLYTNT